MQPIYNFLNCVLILNDFDVKITIHKSAYQVNYPPAGYKDTCLATLKIPTNGLRTKSLVALFGFSKIAELFREIPCDESYRKPLYSMLCNRKRRQ